MDLMKLYLSKLLWTWPFNPSANKWKLRWALMLKEREFESQDQIPHWHVCANNHTFPICFSTSHHEPGSFVYRSTFFSPQAELCIIILNLSRKHVSRIPTSAVRLFLLLSHTTLRSKIVGMRNCREFSATVRLTKSRTVSSARVQMETLWVKERPGLQCVWHD